jgi:cytosine deaminase
MVLIPVYERGGFYNAHAHIDRAFTLGDQYLSHIGTTSIEASNYPLSVKQNLVGDLHTGIAYTEENLRARMSYAIEMQIAFGTTRLDTCIDATPDLPEDGLLAIRIANELKEKYKDRIKIRIAPNPIFGLFRHSARFEVFKEAAKVCDFLSLLPEKDGNENDPKFRLHIREGLKLACELGKEVQLHLDQANLPGENGALTLLKGLEWLDQPTIPSGGPSVKIIHMISPSAYEEEKFALLVEKLLEYKVGIIVCPTAAISMRQLRSIEGPLHNSIARMLELIKMKVPLWIGTDNICDVFVPQGDGDLLTEIKMGGHGVRIATPSIWAKLATGTPLNAVDIATVGRILHEERKACYSVAPKDWVHAVE